MISDHAFEPEVISSDTVFDGRVWDVRRDRIKYGDFEFDRDFVVHTGAVGIIAINERAELLLIDQYRHPVGKVMWEPPAGLLDTADEEPLDAAKRELLEETGYVASTWNVLVDFANSPGGSSEALRCYLAQGLSLHPNGRPVGTDEEAAMVPRWVGLQDVLDGVWGGEVTNVLLVTGTLALISALADLTALRPADAPWPARDHLLHTNRVHRR
jgi:ADP-ribose pyrophosphatase